MTYWHDPTGGQVDRDIQDHLATVHPDDRTRAHIDGINWQRDRNKGRTVLGVDQHPRIGLVKTLLCSDGSAQPGDENLTGLGAAIAGLDEEVQMAVASGLYGYARERLDMAEHAEERALYLPPEEFRDHALESAERAARLWREACHARRRT